MKTQDNPLTSRLCPAAIKKLLGTWGTCVFSKCCDVVRDLGGDFFRRQRARELKN